MALTDDASGHKTTAVYSGYTTTGCASPALSYDATSDVTSNLFSGYTSQAYSARRLYYNAAGTAAVQTLINNDSSHTVSALITGAASTATSAPETFGLTTGDTFALTAAIFGQDTISHYTPGSATFNISTSVFANFAAFQAAESSDGHGGPLVTYDHNYTLLFVGVTPTVLNAL